MSHHLDILNTDLDNRGVVKSEIANYCGANYTATVRPVSKPTCHLLCKK